MSLRACSILVPSRAHLLNAFKLFTSSGGLFNNAEPAWQPQEASGALSGLHTAAVRLGGGVLEFLHLPLPSAVNRVLRRRPAARVFSLVFGSGGDAGVPACAPALPSGWTASPFAANDPAVMISPGRGDDGDGPAAAAAALPFLKEIVLGTRPNDYGGIVSAIAAAGVPAVARAPNLFWPMAGAAAAMRVQPALFSGLVFHAPSDAAAAAWLADNALGCADGGLVGATGVDAGQRRLLAPNALPGLDLRLCARDPALPPPPYFAESSAAMLDGTTVLPPRDGRTSASCVGVAGYVGLDRLKRQLGLDDRPPM